MFILLHLGALSASSSPRLVTSVCSGPPVLLIISISFLPGTQVWVPLSPCLGVLLSEIAIFLGSYLLEGNSVKRQVWISRDRKTLY